MGAERGRERDWAATLADSIVKSQTQALAATNFASFQSFISTLTTVAFIYVGARLALSGQMTIGVLTAALAYHGQFSQRASSLFEQLLAFKMLDVQLERVADIVLQPPERGLEVSSGATRPLLGRLDISDVGFAYSADGPQVLHRVNLSVESGEHVAIAGPSGCGKSTLAKLVCGLYRPLSGEILIDGQTIDQIGLSHLRASLGVVMQDDQLISGSVLENVAFFSEAIDVTRVWECLALARIDDEIRALPLAAETEVGDMGVVFSGGQKQRLLIARALYRQPSILLLDEATSNLDVASEQAIIGTLNELKITRIVISHRPETIAAADRVIRLSRGD
jgi:ATP-binding cassette subfamily B protein RaxB